MHNHQNNLNDPFIHVGDNLILAEEVKYVQRSDSGLNDPVYSRIVLHDSTAIIVQASIDQIASELARALVFNSARLPGPGKPVGPVGESDSIPVNAAQS